MIKELHLEAETNTGRNISSTVAIVPRIRALYHEDVVDAFECARLELVDIVGSNGYEHEPNVAYAGYGLGLCYNYTSWHDCYKAWPSEHLMVLLYTKSAFAVTHCTVCPAYYLWDGALTGIELGHDARHENPTEEFYWEAIRDKLPLFLVKSPYMHPDRVLLTGESALESKFLTILEEALASVMDELPLIYCEDPLFIVAHGALEFVEADYKTSEEINEQEATEAFELSEPNELEL